MESFDIDRVHWEKGKFERWELTQEPKMLKSYDFSENEELIIIEIEGEKIAFLQREVVYHHIIQGKIKNTDFILTFCGVCNAGVLLSPVIKNRVYNFREIGVYNGQQIFEDIETHSLWNHLTGEALWGDLKGNTLKYIGGLTMSTVKEELKNDENIKIFISGKRKVYQKIMRFVIKYILGERNKSWLPPHFTKTLPDVDSSIPKMTMGLAIKVNNEAKFYPIDLIKKELVKDTIENVTFEIKLKGKIPVAVAENEDSIFQLFTRWYAFILTYPKGKRYIRNDIA
jgi:hypothetical protein